MRLVLSTRDVVFCFCSIAAAIYVSPFFIDKVNDNASNDWEFLLIWDDKENFLDNEVITNGLSLTNLYTMFTMTKINVYEPFGWLLKAIQVQLVGLDSWWVRIVSAVLHFMAATVLARTSAVLLDVIALLSDLRSGAVVNSKMTRQREKGNWYGCCISAILFAIHPVHVEVIGWPSAQPYTLCALFSNLALYVYVRAVYRELSGVSIGKKNVKVALMSLVFDGHGSDLLCCGLYWGALLSKSACILLPSGFFFIDVLVFATLQPLLPRPSVRQCWSYIAGKLPVAATLLIFLVVMLTSNHDGMQADTDVLSLTLGERILKATTMPAWILRRILWPTKLRPHYQLRSGELSLSNPEYLLSLSASMALASFTVWLFWHRHAPQHLLALAYFAIMVLPVSGLIQHGMVSAGCDRYAYLCSFVIVPYLGSVLAQYCFGSDGNDAKLIKDERPAQPKRHQSIRDSPGAAGAILVLIGTLLSISTSLMGFWRNEDALLEYSLRMDPTDWRILDQRALFFINSGRYLSTDEECRELWILSYYFTPVGTLKADLHRLKMLLLLKKMEGLCESYQELLDANPDNCHLHNNVAVCLTNQGKLRDARREFELALQSPGNEEQHATPRWNLKAFDQWIALKEEAQARNEEDTLPVVQAQIMY
ncbi:hypothetical protein V7S43_009639 [Phytophthora oleae]|uniref:Dolichyl-phosphate-mannose--protein mannosyltransferase n=1 Tax=Phytophthora oleae TaxID=2107226 RepID=A0ABD3FJ59_9STRA